MSERVGQTSASQPSPAGDASVLSERQAMVLRAVVAAYVADANPASSTTVSHLLPVPLSAASIRNTMAELAALDLLEKPHASAGRVPTEGGLRIFLDHLLEAHSLSAYDQRALADEIDHVEGDMMPGLATLLSLRTHQLGFALRPRLDRLTLRHLSLVRVAENKLLVVVVPKAGATRQRVVEDVGRDDQVELDQMAAALNTRVAGRTLPEAHRMLERELRDLEAEARSLLFRSLALGLRIFQQGISSDEAELVITNRSNLLAQPEFNDPDRIRGLMRALETSERLVELLSCLIDAESPEVSVALGEDLEEPALRRCAVVAVPYGGGAGHSAFDAEAMESRGAEASAEPLGVIGVIGPSRMDYARVIPLVQYCSNLVSLKLSR